MAINKQILKLLETGDHFSLNYWQKISKGCQFVRCVNEPMAIVSKDVKRKIKPRDDDRYEKLMTGEIDEECLKYDFCFLFIETIFVSYFIETEVLTRLPGK